MSDEGPTPLSPTQQSLAASLPAGTLILEGRFRIERLLGGGGMGLVYLATQVSLGRTVAVKVLRDDLPVMEGMGERFKREALLLSSIEHPAVVRVIDFGQMGQSACIVMEYAEGETLEQMLQREAPLSVERAERLIIQLAQGLSAIHARGIVHRDLKPDNVVLTRAPDGREQARLLDFGIARLAQVSEEARVTQVGLVLGTPEYVSPEQALGQELDARSDVYALGVIAFRMLVGSHPFPGPTPREFISQHIHQTPPALLDAVPTLEMFPMLVHAVSACLEKDAARRPQTATGLIELLGAKPIPLPKTSATRTSALNLLIPRRRLSGAAKAGVAAGLAVALLAAGLAFWFQPERRARRYVAQGRGTEALQVIDDMGAPTAPMRMVRAAALYQVGRPDDAWRSLGELPQGQDAEPVTVEALADGFGHQEPARLRKLLTTFTKTSTLPTLQALALGEQSWAQWGALRFIDLEYAGQGLPLTQLYVQALGARDCGMRRTAAGRLSELRSVDAIDPLRKLKAQEKKKGEPDCGQAAAAAALETLEKELNP